MKKIPYKWIALSCTSIGSFFSVLNTTTITIALPEIGKDLNASTSATMWTIMIYMLILTILVPSIGRVADIIGRKKLYISGFIVFTFGSILCSLSQTGWHLVASRFVQAIGGALIISNTMAILSDAFPKKELGKAMGINAMLISVASVFGPFIGGSLIDLGLGWQSIFYLNIPIGIFGTIWASIHLKELTTLPKGQKFDWLGTTTFTIGLLSLLIALSIPNAYTLELYIIAFVLLSLFIFIERKVKYPMLDLRLFKHRLLAFAYSSTLLNGIARGSVTLLLVIYFKQIMGLSSTVSGLALMPFAGSIVIMAPISGILADKYGPRGLSAIGLLITSSGLLGLMFITQTTPLYLTMIFISLIGIGSGTFFSPNTSSIMGSVPTERKGITAGVRTMMNNGGRVISVALAMAIFSAVSKNNFEGLFALDNINIGAGGAMDVDKFMTSLRLVYTVGFGLSIFATFLSYMRGKNKDIVW